MTRIIAGSAKGRRLRVPRGTLVRPTTDRMRESVFSAISSRMRLEGAVVLDAFAGSGALGLEALSRGAEGATFVECRGRVLEVLRANVAALGFEDRAELVRGDVLVWLKGRRHLGGADGGKKSEMRDSGVYDVAFCDPPYDFDSWERLLQLLPARLLVAESDRPVAGAGEGEAVWRVLYEKRLGATVTQLAVRNSDFPRDSEAPEALEADPAKVVRP